MVSLEAEVEGPHPFDVVVVVGPPLLLFAMAPALFLEVVGQPFLLFAMMKIRALF